MDIKALITQLTELFKKLSKTQKLALLGSIVAVVALISFLIVSSSISSSKGQDGYKTLFEGLAPKDAGLIAAELDKQKVPYKITDDGTIRIPSNEVNKQRISIASAGIIKDSRVGFELFDKQDFGATDFEQNIKHERALEGELAKTIESINSISKATVHLAQAKESVFSDKAAPPTAAITLALKPEMKLTNKQVLGIKNLVAASVTNLTPENVKLIDENGDLLGSDTEDSLDGDLAKAQVKYKKDYERAYEDKIINMLTPITGSKDGVAARVTVEFDFSRKNMTSETYDPNSVVRSEQTSEEKREGPKAADIGGVPGVVSNIGPVQGVESQNSPEKYSKTQGTTNYEISKTIANTKGEFATIKRVTAAVVVDGRYEPDPKDPKADKKYVPLPADEIAKVSDIVKQSIGYDQKRGDEVSVVNFKFSREQIDSKSIKGVMTEYGPIINQGLAVLKYLVVFMLLLMVYKKVIAPFAQRMIELPIDEEEANRKIFEEDEIQEDSGSKINELKRRVSEKLGIGGDVNEENLKHDVLLEKLKEMADENTVELAEMLEALVADEIGMQGETVKRKST
jgi:flagellar M-ring protein FliF